MTALFKFSNYDEEDTGYYVEKEIDNTPLIDVPRPVTRTKEEKTEIFIKFREKYGRTNRRIEDFMIDKDSTEENYVRRDDLLAEFILHAFKVGYTIDEFWKLVDKNTGYDANTKEKRIDLFRLFLETKQRQKPYLPQNYELFNPDVYEEEQTYSTTSAMELFNPDVYEKEQTYSANRNLVKQFALDGAGWKFPSRYMKK